MKLLNILARELKVWPGDVGAITQDKLTGELLDYYHCPLRGGNEREVSSIADDAGEAHDGANGAAVTRAEWRAAVDAIYADEPAELKWPDGATHFQEVIGGATRPVFWNVVDGVALKAWRMMPDKVTVEETYTYSSKGCPTFNISKCIERQAPKSVEWEQGDIPNAGDQCEAYVLAETEKQGNPMNKWIRGKFIGRALADNGGIALLVECDDGFTHVINAFSYVRPPRTPDQIAAEEREAVLKEMIVLVGGPSRRSAEVLYAAGYRKQVAP